MIEKMDNGLRQIEKWCMVIALVAMGIIMTLEVVFRLFFGGLTWSEELAKYIFVWMVFIGMSYGIGKDMHIKLDVITIRFSDKIRRILRMICDVVLVVMFIILVRPACQYFISQTTQRTATLGTNMGIVALVMPISFILCIIRLVLDFAKAVKEG